MAGTGKQELHDEKGRLYLSYPAKKWNPVGPGDHEEIGIEKVLMVKSECLQPFHW